MFKFRFRVKRSVLLVVLIVFGLVHLVLYYGQTDSSKDEDTGPGIVQRNEGNHQYQRPIKARSSLKTIDERDTSNIIFRSLEVAHSYMKSVDLKESKRIVVQYSNFSIRLPKFISEKDLEIFMRSTRNTEVLTNSRYELLRGVVEVIPSATFKMDYECGFKSDSSYLKVSRNPSQSHDILVPLVIPMGFLFQHFFDGTLPKIIQAYEFIKRPDVKILMERPFHNNVYQVLDKLGIHHNKIVWHQRSDSKTVYHANQMLFTCVTPPLHPLLWKRMRNILDIKDELQTTFDKSLVVYLTRQGATNGGRTALNEKEVTNFLQKRYQDRFLIFTGKYDFNKAVEVFSKVSIMIGTHGGAFYNLNYAPLSATVIEFGPVLKEGRDIASLPHAIFWVMSDMLGQDYWRIPCQSMNRQHDMNIDINKLEKILDIVDKNHSAR